MPNITQYMIRGETLFFFLKEVKNPNPNYREDKNIKELIW